MVFFISIFYQHYVPRFAEIPRHIVLSLQVGDVSTAAREEQREEFSDASHDQHPVHHHRDLRGRTDYTRVTTAEHTRYTARLPRRAGQHVLRVRRLVPPRLRSRQDEDRGAGRGIV